MSPENIFVLVVLLACLGMSAWAVYASGQKFSIPAVLGRVNETFGSMDELIKASREAVQAAEQLYKTGQIPETADGAKHPKFVYAAERLREYFPTLSDAVIEGAVESAVFWLKNIAPVILGTDNTEQAGVQGAVPVIEVAPEG